MYISLEADADAVLIDFLFIMVLHAHVLFIVDVRPAAVMSALAAHGRDAEESRLYSAAAARV